MSRLRWPAGEAAYDTARLALTVGRAFDQTKQVQSTPTGPAAQADVSARILGSISRLPA